MKNSLRLLWAAILGLGLTGAASAATYTDGIATFSVTLVQDGGNYAPRHILAIWVTDSSGRFVKTLRRQAQNRIQYLYQWIAARGTYTVVDGFTGATTNTYNPITVTWNCRDTNNVVVPDGTYRFYVEFTERNGQGPYTTNGISFVKSTVGVTNTPANVGAYITAMRITYTPVITHDIAVTSLTPTVGNPDTIVPLRVTITNNTSFAEDFTVTVSNLTSSSLIDTQKLVSLTGNAITNLTFPWDAAGNATGQYVLQVVAGPVTDETSTIDNTLTRLFTFRDPTRDVGIARISAPLVVLPNTASNIVVTVTNAGDFTETFGVTLTDTTDSRFLGSNVVANMAPLASRNINFTFNATGSSTGYHTLRAEAISVPGETRLLNNTRDAMLAVAAGTETNTLIARASLWRYNDTGLDLTGTPWSQPYYYDGVWSAGNAPLGYGQANITTTNGFGSDANSKYPSYYYRKRFYADFPPLSLTLRVRRDDGVVLYFNGSEAVRDNLPTGPISFNTFATTNVSDSAQTNYFVFNLDLANVVVGENVVAAEVHQSTNNSSDISFDLELLAVRPRITLVHEVDALQVTASGDALPGDRMTISVTLTNSGNSTETFTVYLKDLTTGQTIGSQSITNLVPGDTTVASITWKTVGAAVTNHMLQAFTVINGVTNWAGAATATGVISSSGIGLNAGNAAGAIGGRCSAVTATSNYLCLAAGATLQILDRANPAVPLKLGEIRLPGLIEDIAVSGSTAFVACGSAGVQMVDISTPSAPVLRNSFNTSGHAYGVAAIGNYLYLADGVAGVRILILTNLAAPTVIGTYYTEGPARAIQVAGSVAYVLDTHKGLQVLQVNNPFLPQFRGSYNGFDAGHALAVSGSMLYAVDGNGKFWIINVANPTVPTLVTNLLLNAVGQAVAVSGTTVYVAAGDNGLLTINAATPSAPVIVATNTSSGQASDITVSGTYAFLANGFAGYQILEVATPTVPTLLGDFAEGMRGSDVVVASGLAYVAAGEAGLRIYSVTNPSAPVLLGRFTGATQARCLAVSGTLACVGDGQHGLKLVNISNPASPVLLGSYSNTNLGSIRSVGAEGSKVVLTDGRLICLVDTRNPAYPELRHTYPAPAFALGLAMADDVAYAACGSQGVLMLDAYRWSLAFLSFYDTPGFASSVAVSGTNLFVADGDRGWLTLDVTYPGDPVLVKSSLSPEPVLGVAASGNSAVFGNGANRASWLDVSSLLTPVPQQNFGPLVRALRLAASDSVAVVAEDEAGLAVLELSSDLDHDGMPDLWEQQIVDANPNDALRTIQDVSPNADFDGDGLSNYAEYLAGTSPTDAASRFMVAVQGQAGGTAVTLSWPSLAGRQYTIYKSTNLLTGFDVLLDNINATPPENTYTETITDSAAFYSIGVR